jgi:pimeloyl-ACP methyl ester carboxylesterase
MKFLSKSIFQISLQLKSREFRIKMTKAKRLILIFLLSAANIFAQTSKVDYGNNPKAGYYNKVNGIKLYYETYGSGEPLIMLHGNGGSIEAFYKQIPYYHVIAIDSRLQGKSGGSPDTISYDLMASDFNELMNQLHIDSAYVLGWSDGGINGLIMALKYPDKVKKLAVSGANTTPDSTAFAYQDILYTKNFVEHDTSASKITIALNKMMLYEPNISYDSLGQIHCPVLIMGGDHDVIKLEHILKIFQSIPKAEMCIFPNSHHNALQEHSKLFNQTVMTFFKK